MSLREMFTEDDYKRIELDLIIEVKTMKIVINTCFGGFSLSKKAYEYLGLAWDGYGYKYSKNRTDPKLVECIENLGEDANGSFAELKVVEILNNVEWEIEEYNGIERVAEKHRVWY